MSSSCHTISIRTDFRKASFRGSKYTSLHDCLLPIQDPRSFINDVPPLPIYSWLMADSRGQQKGSRRGQQLLKGWSRGRCQADQSPIYDLHFSPIPKSLVTVVRLSASQASERADLRLDMLDGIGHASFLLRQCHFRNFALSIRRGFLLVCSQMRAANSWIWICPFDRFGLCHDQTVVLWCNSSLNPVLRSHPLLKPVTSFSCD